MRGTRSNRSIAAATSCSPSGSRSACEADASSAVVPMHSVRESADSSAARRSSTDASVGGSHHGAPRSPSARFAAPTRARASADVAASGRPRSWRRAAINSSTRAARSRSGIAGSDRRQRRPSIVRYRVSSTEESGSDEDCAAMPSCADGRVTARVVDHDRDGPRLAGDGGGDVHGLGVPTNPPASTAEAGPHGGGARLAAPPGGVASRQTHPRDARRPVRVRRCWRSSPTRRMLGS